MALPGEGPTLQEGLLAADWACTSPVSHRLLVLATAMLGNSMEGWRANLEFRPAVYRGDRPQCHFREEPRGTHQRAQGACRGHPLCLHLPSGVFPSQGRSKALKRCVLLHPVYSRSSPCSVEHR